ncbi:MAG: hypothetical protein K2M41_00025 [Muribaculaceae bacterium]|nr:hypothetical protein [Muribaculaceae bacterium]
MSTQMNVQLKAQPHFENETSTVSTTPLPPFFTSRSIMQSAPFNSRSKALKHSPASAGSLMRMGAQRVAAPYPANQPAQCP